MDYRKEIGSMFSQGKNTIDIIKHVYLVRPVCAFYENYEIAEEILSEISKFFGIFISDVLVCGSARLGFSLLKNHDFIPKESDLDLAIINPIIFSRIFDEVIQETKGYGDKTLFKNNDEYDIYTKMVQKGIINPKYMPNIYKKRELKDFFKCMSNRYSDIFSSISICFYLSEVSFQNKQYSALNKWKYNFNQ